MDTKVRLHVFEPWLLGKLPNLAKLLLSQV